MPVRSDHGYSVKRSNEVLRGVSIYSGEDRDRSSTNYHVVRVGVKIGANVEWIATWDQSKQAMKDGEPLAILPASRQGMRLKLDSIIVVELTSVGSPASIRGSSVDLDLSLTGGSAGATRPIISGERGGDADSINKSGMAEKVARIPLDDVRTVGAGAFQGRLQRDSATQISLQRYVGNWIDVDGEAVSITSTGLATTSTSGLISNGGTVTPTLPSASTLYYVYVGMPPGGVAQLRLCATAPTLVNGHYALGTADSQRRWRFAGWARTNASTQFVDDTTDRLVVNYYNRLWKSILLRPAYSDGNSVTTYTTTSTTWTAANAGTGATASYIANGEDGLLITAFTKMKNSGAAFTRIGIGDNSGANCATAAEMFGTTDTPGSCTYSTVPATGYRTIVLLVCVSAGTGTFFADAARSGSATDPVKTGLYTLVPV